LLTVGLDIGTTSVKAALVEAGQSVRVLARESLAYATARPQPGWAEQDPADWWRCACEVLRRLPAVGRARAVAVSGQGSTVCLADADGRPLGNAITWQDNRAVAEAVEIDGRLRADLDRAHGNQLGDAPEPKLVWLSRRDPGRLAGCRLALSAASVVTAGLGGRPVLSIGDACSYLAFDRHRSSWDEAIAEALEIRPLLPLVAAAGEAAGAVTANAAAHTGLPAGIPVVTSTTDVAAAAIAAGAGDPGDVFYSKGTGGFLCLHTRGIDDPGRLVALATGRRGITQVCGAIDTLGSAWDWCRALVGGVGNEEAELLAAQARPGCDGLVLVPWLQGAQHPVLEPDARGVAIGLSLETERGTLLRALLEGTSSLLRANLVVAEDVAGIHVDRIVASGGPTRSALWNSLDAAAVERPIVVAEDSDAAVGSALLAAESLGACSDAVAAGRTLRGDGRRYEPDPELVAAARVIAASSRAASDATLPVLRVFGRQRRQPQAEWAPNPLSSRE